MGDGKNVKILVLVIVVAIVAMIIGLVATSLKKLDSFESMYYLIILCLFKPSV